MGHSQRQLGEHLLDADGMAGIMLPLDAHCWLLINVCRRKKQALIPSGLHLGLQLQYGKCESLMPYFICNIFYWWDRHLCILYWAIVV